MWRIWMIRTAYEVDIEYFRKALRYDCSAVGTTSERYRIPIKIYQIQPVYADRPQKDDLESFFNVTLIS
jgi:hypothetical protein